MKLLILRDKISKPRISAAGVDAKMSVILKELARLEVRISEKMLEFAPAL